MTYDAAANVETSDNVGNNCGAAKAGVAIAGDGLTNHPNPFNAQTQITYHVDVAGPGKLEVFNLLGQSVRVLADGYYQSGTQSVIWDGRDRKGRPASSGTYLYRLTVNGETRVRQMTLLK